VTADLSSNHIGDAFGLLDVIRTELNKMIAR
jgi:hypothetical protein